MFDVFLGLGMAVVGDWVWRRYVCEGIYSSFGIP